MTLYEFYKRYLLINLSDYENIGIDLEINKFLFLIFMGLILATVFVNSRRAGETSLIKKLLRYEAFDEERAKTLGELKSNTLICRSALSGDGRINKIIKRVGKKELTFEEYNLLIKTKGYKEEKINFDEARFYICKEELEEAKGLAENNSASTVNTVLSSILLLTVYVVLMFLMPSILELINGILG